MEIIRRLEQLGYQLREQLTFEYILSDGNPPEESKALLNELRGKRYEAILYLLERSEHPPNIRKAGQYTSEIAKGISNAENPYKLLLKAMECISHMTGDSVFYTAGYENIKAIYGEGLLEIVPLEMELEEMRARIRKLEESLTREGNSENVKARISNAIKAHKLRESYLSEIMQRQV